MDILVPILGLVFAATSGSNSASLPQDITTFRLHERCGSRINLKWESLFMAKLELIPSAIVVNTSSNGAPGNGNHGNQLQSCEVNIESWDFQNRLMVIFEELELGDAPSCTGPSLEILDGPDGQSPGVSGLPDMIYSCQSQELVSRSFVTSDKHLTIRFHGDGTTNTRIVVRATIVAFKQGPCRSYEYECSNSRCIMEDLVCNGHNPCADNSDCRRLEVPVEVVTTEEEVNESVIIVVVIAVSTTLVMITVTAVVLVRCYCLRQKHQRLHRLQTSTQTSRQISTEPMYQRTLSEVESDRQFAPPSYANLQDIVDMESHPSHESSRAESVNEDEGQDGQDTEPEETDSLTSSEETTDPCLRPSDMPPSYACVLLHHEEYHVSETSLPEVPRTPDQT